MTPVKKFFVYKCKSRLSLALLYLAYLILFFTKWFLIQRELTTPFSRNVPEIAKKITYLLNVCWLKVEIIIQVFLSYLLLFSSVWVVLQCHYQVVYFLSGGQGRTCTI